MTKATHTGTCQACGRTQVQRATGHIAKHGYTTTWGFFNGTCSGSEHGALENGTGHNIATVRAICDWANEQELRAVGEIQAVPVEVRTRNSYGNTEKTTEWMDCTTYESRMPSYSKFDAAVEHYKASLTRAAKSARKDAADLDALRGKVFGQPLKPIAVEMPIYRETADSWKSAYARIQELAAAGITAQSRRQSHSRGFNITYRK